jgi:hypothetical protein
VGAVIIVVGGLATYLVSQGSSSGSSPDAVAATGSTTPGATPDLAAQYAAIADEANAREAPLKEEASRLAGLGTVGAMPAPEAQDLFRRMAAAQRDFDAKLAQIPFPPKIAEHAQAVIIIDQQIAAGYDKLVAGCTDACTVWAETAPYFDLRTQAIQTLRADLGLPPTA